MDSAQWLRRLQWFRRPPLLKALAALGVICALAFALGQGVATLHASRLAAQATLDGQVNHPMNPPLAAEQVNAAKGVLPTIVNPGAPPGQAAFTTGQQPTQSSAPMASEISDQGHPQTDQAPLKHADKKANKHDGVHGNGADASGQQGATQGATLRAGKAHKGGPQSARHGAAQGKSVSD